MNIRLAPSSVVLATAVGAALLASQAPAAPPKVVFSRQILPLLNKECGSCHRGAAAPGGYSLESAEKLVAGGRHGAAVVPGKSANSTLVKYMTGELKPQMPPGKPLPLDTIALIRRWIDEGAKIDSMVAPVEAGGIMRNAMPMGGGPKRRGVAHGRVALLPAPVTQAAPVTALGYSPDGTLLAAGGYRSVRLLEPATGKVLHTLAGPSEQVLSLAWSPDGKRLAAAGGESGSFGEVCVWDVPSPGASWNKPRVLRDHADTIFAVAWRPGTGEFATASNDKTAKVWDLTTGKATRTLKDHVDVVFAVAYSPDGKWLATGSADRTIKLYQTETGAKAASLSHGEGVTAVAFSAKSDLVVSATQDKRVSVWPVRAGAIENPLRGHGEGEAVTAVAFSSQGDTFVWGASNRKVRIWNGEVSQHRREMSDAPDWVYAVAASPDGKQVAAGCGDGNVYFWGTNDGKLERSVPLGGPAPVAAATAAEAKQ